MLVLVFRSRTFQPLNPLYQHLNSHEVPLYIFYEGGGEKLLNYQLIM